MLCDSMFRARTFLHKRGEDAKDEPANDLFRPDIRDMTELNSQSPPKANVNNLVVIDPKTAQG